MLEGLLQPTHLILLFLVFGLPVGVVFLAYRSGYDRGYRKGLEKAMERSGHR